ncbi:MAG: hypothetical protein CMI31_11660 [Opitutae bacterium]|nr:hypothetical protein [Opitutae bacterium]
MDRWQAKDKLYRKWEKNLKHHGVIFPEGEARLLALLCLYAHFKKPITQDEMVAWIQENGGRYDRQARHLGSDGWFLKSGNTRSTRIKCDQRMRRDELMLHSVKKPNPIWLKQRKISRLYELGKGDWSELLETFADRGCAVCGRFVKHYDKGHLDPQRPYSIENIVPMCVECNNWAGAHNVTFQLDKRNLIARPIKFTFES